MRLDKREYNEQIYIANIFVSVELFLDEKLARNVKCKQIKMCKYSL